MMTRNLTLLGLILLGTPSLVFCGSDITNSVRIQTAPPDSDYCVRCETDEACQAYATGSTCKRGQCTDENGLFGRNCYCKNNSECSSDRCDGIFQKTCMKRLEKGSVCYSDKVCESGYCNPFLLCADPPSQGKATYEESGIESVEATAAEDVNAEPTQPPTGGNDDGEDDVPSCVACYDDSECDGDGQCMEGFCADAFGVLPITCLTCHGDDDCNEHTFCHGLGLLGRSGKKCAEKREIGASCSRSEACQSGNCNMLFRCSNNTHHTDRPLVEMPQRNGYVGLAVWASVAILLTLFLCLAKAFIQRDGLQALKRKNAIIPDGLHELGLDYEGDDSKSGDEENTHSTEDHSTADVEEQ